MANIRILELLDMCDTLVSKSRRVPLSSKIIIDGDQLLDLIDEMRVALPEDVKDAQRLMAERDKLIGDARQEAEKVIGSARERVQSLISESEIAKRAMDYAQSIINDVKNQAEEIRRGADDYALSILKSLEESLLRAQKAVEKGVEELEKRAASSGAPARGNAPGSSDGTPAKAAAAK